MKKPTLIVMACLLLAACTQASPIKAKDPKFQALVDRTLKNMVFVEGGSYMMGDPGDELVAAFGDQAFYFYLPCKDNKPAHKVTLDRYYMGKFEVTYEEHDLFTTATGRELTNQRFLDWGRSQELGEWARKKYRDGRAPEISAGVSWHGAKEYCEWLGEQTGLPFDLPTEAQWEYAARSRGMLVPFATDTGFIERGVNYPRGLDYPTPPGSFPPNPLGLYDMSGNAVEWVRDWYDPDYYSHSSEHNPQGPETGKKKVVRGGGTHSSPSGSSTVSRRYGGLGHESISGMGFRCVINTDQSLPVGK
jgi:formylglycine-generating enzyme required for sulfatase activity